MLSLFAFLAVTIGASVPSDPLPSPRTVLTDKDYPAAARNNGERGDVEFVLDIDTEGRPVACKVAASSGSALLDAATCKVQLERGRFLPARDVSGVAVAGRYRDFTSWKIFDGVAQPNAGYSLRVVFDADGSVLECGAFPLVKNGYVPAEAHKRCDSQGNSASFAALLGQSTKGLASAESRTIKTDSAGAAAFVGTGLRRVLADAEYVERGPGRIAACRMVSAVGPGHVDLCSTSLKPTMASTGKGGRTRRIILDVVAVPR